MKYAQFFRTPDAEALGSDGVFIMDGRWKLARMHAAASAHARKRGYVAYQLRTGPRFTESRPISPIVEVKDE